MKQVFLFLGLFATCHDQYNAQNGHHAACIGRPSDMLVLSLMDFERAQFSHFFLRLEIDAFPNQHSHTDDEQDNAYCFHMRFILPAQIRGVREDNDFF